MVDGGCPEVINPTPCSDIPLPARVSIKDSSGTSVGEATSNDQGEFRIELPPGTYQIHPENLTGAPLPEAPPENVTVKSGTFTEVRIQFDSGVR